jgi:hypothetical protein
MMKAEMKPGGVLGPMPNQHPQVFKALRRFVLSSSFQCGVQLTTGMFLVCLFIFIRQVCGSHCNGSFTGCTVNGCTTQQSYPPRRCHHAALKHQLHACDGHASHKPITHTLESSTHWTLLNYFVPTDGQVFLTAVDARTTTNQPTNQLVMPNTLLVAKYCNSTPKGQQHHTLNCPSHVLFAKYRHPTGIPSDQHPGHEATQSPRLGVFRAGCPFVWTAMHI